MSGAHIPLLAGRAAGRPLAWWQGRALSEDDFLSAAFDLAQDLPGTGPLLNLCTDRIHFALTLCAAVYAGRVSLLPNATAPGNLQALRTAYPDLAGIGDTDAAPCADLPWRRINADFAARSGAAVSRPDIAAGQLVARVFTSGSTGQPVAHDKTFARLRQNARGGAERLWPAFGGPCALVGTVPFQHMYGLEPTVLLALFGGGMLTAGRPFYPADIVAELAGVPEPRCLVTTPFHLRALLDAGLPCPPLAGILSATAPLAPELAVRAEQVLGAPLLEIYGATETGQLATRRPAQGSPWQTLPGIALRQHEAVTLAGGGHLECEQALGDVIELHDATHFTLLGRHADMVNVAGKRSSLAYLNQLACRLPGISDAAFCLPAGDEGADLQRLTAFIVAPGLSRQQVLAQLRLHLDPVFLPRPLVLLDALPRNATGKLTAGALAALLASHTGKGAEDA